MTQENTQRSSEVKPAAPRFDAPWLKVHAKTIGSRIGFSMPVVNVSQSGLLLSWKGSQRSPFNVNTILELEINGPTGGEVKKVDCLGKIVRSFSDKTGTASFGVKIIQTEAEEQENWLYIIRSLRASKSTNL